MKKVLFIILMAIPFSNYSFASEELFNKANALYKQEQYDSAIAIYDSILKNGFESSDMFYNMGNSYYKLEQWPESILYYEKSLKRNPNNSDVIYNLNLAQLNIVDRIEPLPELFYKKWWKNIYYLTSIDTWGILSIILLWISLFLFLINRFKVFINKYYFIVLLTCALLSLSLAYSQYDGMMKSKYAILYNPSVVVKSAPSYSATDIFTIHSGTKVKVIDQIGNWIHINIVNGNKGWIKKNTCKEI